METDNNHWGARINQIRKDKGISVAQYAADMGFSESRAYTLFKQRFIRPEVLIKTAGVLGIAPETLVPTFSNDNQKIDYRLEEMLNRNNELKSENAELRTQNSELTKSLNNLIKLFGKKSPNSLVLT